MACELNTGPLIEAIRFKFQVAHKSLPEVVNKAMKDVDLRSIAFTPAVSRQVISDQLRAVVQARYTTKTGRKLKRPKITYTANDAAVAIMVARLRKEGKLANYTGAQIREMATAMANARAISGSYLKAGLLAAAQPFDGPTSAQGGEVHLYHAPGEGILATADNLVAEIHNDVPVAHWKASGQGAYAAAERALQQGLDATEADILVYVDRKLREAGFDS